MSILLLTEVIAAVYPAEVPTAKSKKLMGNGEKNRPARLGVGPRKSKKDTRSLQGKGVQCSLLSERTRKVLLPPKRWPATGWATGMVRSGRDGSGITVGRDLSSWTEGSYSPWRSLQIYLASSSLSRDWRRRTMCRASVALNSHNDREEDPKERRDLCR